MKWMLIALMAVSQWAFAAPEVGKMAPNFSLKGHDGKTYKLSDMKGQWVVLEWFNNECPYVEKHYHADFRNMQNLQQKWISEGNSKGTLNWFAVASSAPGKQGHLTPTQAKEIRDKERKANMTAILLDESGNVGKLYEAKTTPHMFIINPKGTLVYNGAIDDNPSAQTSSLKGAKNYVNSALEALFDSKAVAMSTTKPYGCSVKYKN